MGVYPGPHQALHPDAVAPHLLYQVGDEVDCGHHPHRALPHRLKLGDFVLLGGGLG